MKKTEANIVESGKKGKEDISRLEGLVDSLELISARMLEMMVTNNQLASSQTPEMRVLFQKWIELMSDQLLAMACEEGDVDLIKLSEKIGISRVTAASFLIYLDRKGDIEITGMQVKRGDGKNRDICGCISS